MKNQPKGICAQFDEDVVNHGGYLYTHNPSLSSLLANQLLTEATLDFLVLKGRRVIDVGCGDGVYTHELNSRGKPKLIIGTDFAGRAIDQAKRKYEQGNKGLSFKTESCYKISFPNNYFDIAIARGLLHHLKEPQIAVKEMFRVAKEVLIIEPNGNNLILKAIEKLSGYHRKHQEKSYPPSCIRQWITAGGGSIEREDYLGLVPFFCPDLLAKLLKQTEPLIEKSFLKQFVCAEVVIKAKKN